MAKPSLPELKLPKLSLEAIFASQKANLATVHEAQTVLVEAVQAITKAQHGWVEETVAGTKAVLEARAPKQPEAVLAEVKVTADRAIAVARQGVELAVAAQQRVAGLLSKRAAANLSELKALAA